MRALKAFWTWVTGPTPPRGAELVEVPAGRVVFDGRRVRVRRFDLDCRTVTNREYREFVEATGGRTPDWMYRHGFDDPDQPVVGVTYTEAVQFARWAGKRLPTEREWIRAARGDDDRPYPWGDCPPDAARACFGAARQGVPSIASDPEARPLSAGPFGHHDLAGNVWEWTADGVLCGGFWGAADVRIDTRLREPPHRISAGIGFRCAR